MNPIKLGIIGCGIAARKLHYPALQNLKDKFEVTMVCNHTEEKAKSFAELMGGVNYVLDYHDLLKNPEIEAVLIILPIHLNYRVTLDSLKAKKHVLVEKPLAANLDEARKMLLFKKLYPQVKMVAENFRYKNTFNRVKKIIEDGIIGTPYATFWNICFQITTENPYAQTKWRIKHVYPGGFVTDGGVHFIAALRMLFGEFIETHAFSKGINPEIGRTDTYSLQFKTENEVNGILNIFFSTVGFEQNKIHIFGDKGTILIEGNEVKIKTSKTDEHSESIEDDGGYTNQLLGFYSAIREGKHVLSTFEQSYRDLEIILESLEI